MNRYLRVGVGIFLSILVLTQFLAYQQYRITAVEQSKKLEDELNDVSERLKKTLSYSLSATSTLAFIVERYGFPQDFESLARDILSSYEYIDALELTRQGVIIDVFPLEGNEAALGLDILKLPRASMEARKAIERGSLFFAGPQELIQGGVAIIGRLPMYQDTRFVGFSVAIIKLQTLINAIGVNPSSEKEFIYQLSKINPITNEEEFFLKDPIDKNLENVTSVNIADGEWILYVGPKSNFAIYQQALGFSILGLILSLVTGLFFLYWARQPEKLNELVEQKTIELKREKDLSDSIINSLPGVFFLFNRMGKLVRWNKYMETISGFEPDEIIEKSAGDFLKDENSDEISNAIAETFDKGENEIEIILNLQNGSKVPYYLYGRKIMLGEEEYLIGMGIDISDRVRAEQTALDASKEKEITLNRINDGVVSFDREWNFVFINDAALTYIPGSRETSLGRNLVDISPNIVNTSIWDTLQKAFEAMSEREIDIFYEPLEKWFFVKIYPSENGTTVFFKDVTNIKRVERETMKMIGRELHDNVVQVLTGAGLFLNVGKRKAGGSNEDLDKVDELIKKGIEEIRMLSHDLISPFMQGETLENAVREIFTQASEAADFNVQFQFENFREELLSDKLKTSTFRVIQEQCNNILKYAHPKNVIVRLAVTEEEFSIHIKDDGVGFDPEVKSNGIGFINIRSRIDLFSGKLKIGAAPGKGCEIRVSFPLPERVVV